MYLMYSHELLSYFFSSYIFSLSLFIKNQNIAVIIKGKSKQLARHTSRIFASSCNVNASNGKGLRPHLSENWLNIKSWHVIHSSAV